MERVQITLWPLKNQDKNTEEKKQHISKDLQVHENPTQCNIGENKETELIFSEKLSEGNGSLFVSKLIFGKFWLAGVQQ